MIITHEYAADKPFGYKQTLFDEDLKQWPIAQQITRTASGGYQFEAQSEDEFGSPSIVKIILEKLDVEAIKEMIEKDLI